MSNKNSNNEGTYRYFVVITVLLFVTIVSDILGQPLISGVGSIAIISALIAGLINLISNQVQNKTHQKIAGDNFLHERAERRALRAYKIVDDQYDVLSKGINRILDEITSLDLYTEALLSSYNQISLREYQELQPKLSSNDGEIIKLRTELLSLGDDLLVTYWEEACKAREEKLEIFEKVKDAADDAIFGGPVFPQGFFYSASHDEEVTGRFLNATVELKRRLKELRISEQKLRG